MEAEATARAVGPAAAVNAMEPARRVIAAHPMDGDRGLAQLRANGNKGPEGVVVGEGAVPGGGWKPTMTMPQRRKSLAVGHKVLKGGSRG